MNDENGISRRKFIRQSALFGAAAATLAGTGGLFVNESQAANNLQNVSSRGYAARDASSPLGVWKFERRPLGDNDVLIDIKFSGICHTDIHQLRGDWGPQRYPQVPGHEIAGVVSAVGKNVSKFKVGDSAGVGCMVDSCGTCASCKRGEEQYCDKGQVLWTYGTPDKTSPTGITQGGYSNNIVVKEHFAIKIPKTMSLQNAAPLLCAGITTYSPLMRESIKKGDKVAVVGIGGLGHLAVKLASSKGADVYAFTTSPSKVKDILSFGAKEVIVVDSVDKLTPYGKTVDYMISTIPYDHDVSAYTSVVKPYGEYIQLGVAVKGDYTVNSFVLNRNRVKYTASLIGSIAQTQEMIDYCAQKKIYPQIQVIKAGQINEAWQKVKNKEARYRYVIDAATI